MKTIQEVTLVVMLWAVLQMILTDLPTEKQDLLGIVLFCLPIFLYASHIVGIKKNEK
jgi:hypothetical protein